MEGYENYNDVSYQRVPSDEECVLTAPAIAKMLGEEDSVIRTWAKIHKDYLSIKKINGRFAYTQESVKEFKFIQDLCRGKNFTHKQISEHISKKGFEYAKYDGGLVNPEDPLGFEALASQLAIKNGEQLKEFLLKFMEYQDNFKNELKEELKSEIAISVDEHLEDKLNEFKNDMQIFINQRELEYKKQDEERISMLKAHMEDTKKKSEKENSKKGFWSRILGK